MPFKLQFCCLNGSSNGVNGTDNDLARMENAGVVALKMHIRSAQLEIYRANHDLKGRKFFLLT